MKVPFIDLTPQHDAIKGEMEAGFKATFERCDFISGKATKDFEKEFASFCGVQKAVGVNSGTDSLYLALCSLDVTVGDEVILPSFTFIATALAVSYTGATVVFADIEEKTGNIDPASFEKVITDKTKAVIPVHLYGQPANMDEICAIAKKNNVKVIEDACQAHGSTYDGKRSGSMGDIGCFSFYPTKSLGGCGDGGIIVSDSVEIGEKVRMLGDYGRSSRYDHKIKGFNSRLDSMQAVILSAKLKHLDEWNKMRGENAAYYCELLKDVDGIILPKIQDNRTHVFQTFAVRILENRDQVCEKMQEKGVGVLIHYPIPLHLQEAYRDMGHKKGDFPVSEMFSDQVLSLPLFPHMSKEQIEYVAKSLKEILKG